MRRLLPLLLALPLAARAQSSGQIVFAPDSTINSDECAAAATTSLTIAWNTTLDGATFTPVNSQYVVYASTDALSGNYCAVGGLNTAQIGATISNPTTLTGTTTVFVADVLNASKATCSASQTIHVCVHYTIAGTNRGYAKGDLSLNVLVPSAPVVGAVRPGDSALYVTIQPGAGGPVAADHFKAAITGPDAVVHLSSDTGAGQEVRVGGLTNGIAYNVAAYAYSSVGNRSPLSAAFVPASPADVTPQPVLDAWDQYLAAGGRDSGGCEAGGAGLLALLGAASLLRIRRRP